MNAKAYILNFETADTMTKNVQRKIHVIPIGIARTCRYRLKQNVVWKVLLVALIKRSIVLICTKLENNLERRSDRKRKKLYYVRFLRRALVFYWYIQYKKRTYLKKKYLRSQLFNKTEFTFNASEKGKSKSWGSYVIYVFSHRSW